MTIKPFRLQTKQLFLTYSQIDQSFTQELILTQLQAKFKEIKNYIIALEKHEKEGIHCHALIILNKRCNIRNVNYLDLVYNDLTYHGNYQSVKNITSTVKYITKDNNYITNLELTENKEILTLEAKLVLLVESNGLEYALQYIRDNHKDIIPRRYNQLKNNLKTFYRDFQKAKSEPLESYSINDYVRNQEIDNAVQNTKPTKLIYIQGPTNTRKTSYTVALVKELHGSRYLFVRHLDQLKQYKPELHDAIILDDCKLPYGRNELLNLCDLEMPTAVDVKFDVITLLAKKLRILITNEYFEDMLASRNLSKDEAIRRRVNVITVPTQINININKLVINNIIQNNITNNKS